MQGKIEWFNKERGFGFITPDEDAGNIFFHVTNVDTRSRETLENNLKDNQRASYDLQDTPKGPAAVNVRLHG